MRPRKETVRNATGPRPYGEGRPRAPGDARSGANQNLMPARTPNTASFPAPFTHSMVPPK
jgi:hypothetical protein